MKPAARRGKWIPLAIGVALSVVTTPIFRAFLPMLMASERYPVFAFVSDFLFAPIFLAYRWVPDLPFVRETYYFLGVCAALYPAYGFIGVLLSLNWWKWLLMVLCVQVLAFTILRMLR
jgi:hypothetical protein